MGIPGLLKEIGKGERIALSKLSVQHLEKTNRPLRVAIDAAIWNFQNQAGQGGKNPALRTLFYRLLRILALPIDPVFVYDGKNKPLTKRGKTVSRYHGTCISNEASKKLIRMFRFPCHVAAGEAEAECAFLQTTGIVDAVMSQDVDAIMFGSKLTLRDWSHEGSKGNKAPTHVSVLDEAGIKSRSGLDTDGMILIALLSGGDYDEAGVPGFGSSLACEIARAGFGKDLLDSIRNDDESGVREWRERLQYELETNESGYFRTKHKSLTVPPSFPDRTILQYYTNPAITQLDELTDLQRQWQEIWGTPINVTDLRQYVADMFDWQYKPGAFKFVRTLAPSLLGCFLRNKQGQKYIQSVDQISERRQHFVTSGLSELRVSVVPANVVGLELDNEADSPEYLASLDAEHDEEAEYVEDAANAEPVETGPSTQASPTKSRKTFAWTPYMPEKMWLPETIVQLGVPALVEYWYENQRELQNDPKKFATRKCPKKPKASKPAQSSTLDLFFKNSKSRRQPTMEPTKGSVVPTTEDTIEITSSPVRNKGLAHTNQADKPVMSQSQESTASSVVELSYRDIPLSPSVTLRKKNKLSAQNSMEVPFPRNTPRRPRSIESFFGPRIYNDMTSLKKRHAAVGAGMAEQHVPPELTTGLRTHLDLDRKLAQPRDSLQGAWKEASDDEMFAAVTTKTSSRRLPRVSHVDLTGD